MRRYLDALRTRLMLLASRAVVRIVDASLKMQTVQLDLLQGETRDGVEHWEPYGFTSHPFAGAEALAIALGGNRDHTIAISVADRRYRIKTLAEGEVALYDDQGQAVTIKRNQVRVDAVGQVIVSGPSFVQLVSSAQIQLVAPLVAVVGELQATGNITDNALGAGKSMAAHRATYNSHTHDETGTVTDPPHEQI